MKRRRIKPVVKGILKTGVMIPITDPAEQAELDRRCRDAEKAMAASNGRFTDARISDSGIVMKTHEFTLVLTTIPTAAKAEKFHGICQDATLAVNTGVGHVRFHREADSLENALRSALQDVKAAGLRVERVEMKPDAVQT